MNCPKAFLLATDFDPASLLAAEAAVHLARTFDARVSILHVLGPVPTWPSAEHYLEGIAETRLRELSQRLGNQKVAVADGSISRGSRAGEILSKARASAIDLIVLGAGKKSPPDRFSAGPVAETVLELASQPVLAVHPTAPAPKFQRILCPVDHSPASARGLRNAVRLADACGSHLVVLSVVPEVSWLSEAVETGQLVGVTDEYRFRWLEEYDRFLQSVDFGAVSWQKEVRGGAPDRQIVAAAQEHQADVIVMSSTGRTGSVHVLMGSVARHVLQDLPCSLLTVKDEDLVEAPSAADAHVAGSSSGKSAQEGAQDRRRPPAA